MHDPSIAAEAARSLPPDVIASPYYNDDLAPVPAARRTWTTYNFSALWISMAHCIPTYMLAAGLIGVGMSWWQALLTIALGNTIVLVPILLNAHPGTKYGIPFPVFARASFGIRGANIAAILRALVACGWFGIQSFIGGKAIDTFLMSVSPGWAHAFAGVGFLGLGLRPWITFLLFWGLNILIIYKGMNAVRVFENWAAPLVLMMAAALLWWAVTAAHGLGDLLDKPSQLKDLGEFWPVFVASLTGMIGYWATLSLNIPDFTRFGRSQRDQILGQALGLPTTMTAFSAMGVVITSAASVVFGRAIWDPVELLQQFHSPVVAVLSLFGVTVATLSVNIAANVISPANDFSNLAPKLISFKTGGLITGLLGIACMPWKLLASPKVYIFDLLVGFSALLGPIAGVMIADYWVIRRQELDVPDLFRAEGRYHYANGFNPRAIAALALGMAAAGAGKVMFWLTGSASWNALFNYAWFLGFGVAFLAYWGLMTGARGAEVPAVEPAPK